MILLSIGVYPRNFVPLGDAGEEALETMKNPCPLPARPCATPEVIQRIVEYGPYKIMYYFLLQLRTAG